jgi:hypothetical protein
MPSNNGRVEIVDITPAMAAAWLGKNRGNRNIRKSVVERYARDILAGDWRETDAMYTVREDGVLLDGQHRAHAIVLADKTIRGVVHFVGGDLCPMDLRVDVGIGRNASDLLGVGCAEAAVSRTLINMATRRNQMASVDALGAVVELVSRQFGLLTSSTRRGLSTAPVRAAVCYSMWRWPSSQSEICSQYAELVLDHRDMEVWPAFAGAARQVLQANLLGKQMPMVEAFLRVAKALDPEFRYQRRVIFKDQEVYRAKIEPLVAQYIGYPSSVPTIERF